MRYYQPVIVGLYSGHRTPVTFSRTRSREVAEERAIRMRMKAHDELTAIEVEVVDVVDLGRPFVVIALYALAGAAIGLSLGVWWVPAYTLPMSVAVNVAWYRRVPLSGPTPEPGSGPWTTKHG